MNENHEHDIQPEILDQLMLLTRLSRRVVMRMPRPAHASHGGNRLRRILHSNPGLSSRELAEILDVRPSSLSQQLEKLEVRGEIRRERDEQDSRVSHIYLTELSEALLNESKASIQAMHDHFSACFTPEEKEQFIALCMKLSAYLSDDIGEDEEGSTGQWPGGAQGSHGRRAHRGKRHGFGPRGPHMHRGMHHHGMHCASHAHGANPSGDHCPKQNDENDPECEKNNSEC